MDFQYRILCVDSNFDACNEITSLLVDSVKNYSLTSTVSSAEALALIEEEPFDLYLIDCLSTGEEINRVDLCRRIRLNDAETPIIFFGTTEDIFSRTRAIKFGADQCLVKPISLNILEETVEQLLNEKQIRDEMNVDFEYGDDKPARLFSFM